LYPGPEARNLALTPAIEHPQSLVVIDGTWHHARTLFRDQPLLRQLPQYYFTPKAPTEYRVRREPRSDYVSTVEAVVIALELLEPGASYAQMLEPFRHMIDLHIAATERAERRPRHRQARPAGVRALPKALVEHIERAVLVYGESVPAESRSDLARSLCYWTAKRLVGGDTLAEFVESCTPVSDVCLEHMGLSRALLEQAASLAAVQRRWRAFLQKEDIIIAWNEKTLALMRELDTPAAQSLSLKATYRRFKAERAHCGSLDAVVEGEGLNVSPLPFVGRAGMRLAQAEAIAWHLRSFASPNQWLT
jgi:hypothetical protein